MITIVGPQFASFRLPLPDGVSEADTPTASMVRGLADRGTPQLRKLSNPERESLFLSLATTVTRATYHRLRIEHLARQMAARQVQVGGALTVGDVCAQFIMYEAAAMLAAARTAVDEIAYIAARRGGAADAAKWEVKQLMAPKPARKYDIGEARLLRRSRRWYEELNAYRNVITHRGWRYTLGYFPIGSPVPEAADHTRNVMLIPDRASIERGKRPPDWTYLS